jgi:hypothetical protein
VAVNNCTFNGPSLMRIYTTPGGPGFRVDTVSVSNCSGTFTEAAFLIGLANGSLPNSVASMTISDCNLTALAVLGIAENFGNIALSNVNFTPTLFNVVWIAPQANHLCGFVRPSPFNGNTTSVGSNLTFNNCKISRNSNVEVAAVIIENNSVIDNVVFNGFSVQDSGSYSVVEELLNIGSGSIGQVSIGSLDSNNIKEPVSPGGFSTIGSVSGAGVLATGWEFPDAVMANGVPYISENSGSPSIKVDGVVEPYPQP